MIRVILVQIHRLYSCTGKHTEWLWFYWYVLRSYCNAHLQRPYITHKTLPHVHGLLHFREHARRERELRQSVIRPRRRAPLFPSMRIATVNASTVNPNTESNTVNAKPYYTCNMRLIGWLHKHCCFVLLTAIIAAVYHALSLWHSLSHAIRILYHKISRAIARYHANCKPNLYDSITGVD